MGNLSSLPLNLYTYYIYIYIYHIDRYHLSCDGAGVLFVLEAGKMAGKYKCNNVYRRALIYTFTRFIGNIFKISDGKCDCKVTENRVTK